MRYIILLIIFELLFCKCNNYEKHNECDLKFIGDLSKINYIIDSLKNEASSIPFSTFEGTPYLVIEESIEEIDEEFSISISDTISIRYYETYPSNQYEYGGMQAIRYILLKKNNSYSGSFGLNIKGKYLYDIHDTIGVSDTMELMSVDKLKTQAYKLSFEIKKEPGIYVFDLQNLDKLALNRTISLTKEFDYTIELISDVNKGNLIIEKPILIGAYWTDLDRIK